MDLQRRFKRLRTFLGKHEELLQSEVLNRYPREAPAPYNEWPEQVKNLTPQELIEIERSLNPLKLSGEAREFMEELAPLLQIPQAAFASSDYSPGNYSPGNRLPGELERGMTLKKRHEILNIKEFLRDKTYRSFLDIGSGKGHLSMGLLWNNDGRSVCVDMDQTLQDSGARKIARYCPELRNKLRYRNLVFNSQADLESSPGQLLLSLHSCGDLSVEAINFHRQGRGDLLNFGCCYHKGEKRALSRAAQENPLPLTRHALTLAARSNRQMSLEDFRRRRRVKLYRYILHMILVDRLGEAFVALGSAHYKDYDLPFEEYARKHAPQAKELDLPGLYRSYLESPILEQYLLYDTFRSPLGRAAELYILLDRALYLQENGKEVQVRAHFDPKLSPRNIGIFSKSVLQ